MPNIANFSFTKTAPVFDPSKVLPGTAVHVEGGTRANKTYFEGNGIVTSTSQLSMVVELFNIHTLVFQTLTISVDDFINNTYLVNLLTVEDGTGSEITGSIPSDLTPPTEVSSFSVEVTHESATLTYVMPSDLDFDHVQIFQDDALIADNVTTTTHLVTGLSAATNYEFVIKTVDTLGNISEGNLLFVTTDVAP